MIRSMIIGLVVLGAFSNSLPQTPSSSLPLLSRRYQAGGRTFSQQPGVSEDSSGPLRFDAPPGFPENEDVRTRVAAIIAVLWVANLVATSAAVCVGWQGTPAARAACCKAAGHHCPQQGQQTADQCCARSEPGHQSATLTALTAVIKPAVMTTVILDLLASQAQSAHAATVARAFEASTLTIPHDSPHLVFSVFRI